MAGNVDRRIIQMRFENRQFEKNIAKSTKSVEDLKKAMNFDETSNGLKKFADSTKELTLASFDKLTNNIQKLTDKFTGLGTLSELVLSQIRRGIEGVARDISNFVSSLSTAQIPAGLEKYNTLNKSVQTIKAATGESENTVYKVLKRLSNYTDQTSYNFADMAQNIGKFTSVGIDLESAERQMEGIANWAARSGAGINEASRAMYNLSQAMGVGKLTRIDWKSIENAGMATKEFKEQLIQAGVAAGTLVEKKGKYFTKKGNTEVNFKNVSDTLAKGWATSQVLSSALEKYYYDDLYYENENQEAILNLSETQKQEFDKMIASANKLDASEWKALENMGVITDVAREKIVKLAISQGKLTKETKEDGSIVYKTVNKTGKQIEFTLDEIEKSLSAGWLDKGVADAATSINELAKESYEAAQKCLTFTDVLGAWKDQISSGWMRSFTIIFGELSEAMEFFSNVCNRVGEAFDNLISFRNGVLEQWSLKGGRQGFIDLILGDYGKDLETGAVGLLDILEDVAGLITKGFQDFILAINPGIMLNDAFSKDKWENNAEYRMYVLSDMLVGFTDRVKEFFAEIQRYFNENIEVNGKMTTRLQMIQDIVFGFVGVLAFAFNIGQRAFDFLNNIGRDLEPSITAIIGLLSDLGMSIYNTAIEAESEGKLQKFFEDLHTIVLPLITAFNGLISAIAEVFRTLLGLDKEGSTQAEALSKIGDVIKYIARTVSSYAAPVIQFFTNLFGIIHDLISGDLDISNLSAIGERIKTAFNSMIAGLPEPIQKLIGYIKTVFNAIKTLFAEGFTSKNLKDLGELLKKPFAKALDLIPDSIKDKFNEILVKIKIFFQNFWNKILKFWESITGKDSKSGENNIVNKVLEPLIGKENSSVNDVLPQKSIFETIRDWIKEKFEALLTFIQNAVGNVGGTANSFGQKVSELIEKLKQINLSKVLLWLMGGLGVAAVVLMIAKIYKMFKLLAKGISAIGDAIKNGISLKLKDSDKKIESFGDKMLKIAGAIAILTACIVVIGNMDAYEALRGIVYMITLMIALVGMSYALKKVYSDMDWKSGIAIFLGLVGTAIAIGILVDALTKIGQMNFWQFAQSILGLAAVIFALAVVGELSKDGQFQFSNLSGMIALAISIGILISALNKIKNANPTQLITMGGSLIGLLTILYVFMKMVSKNNISMAESGMTQMIALAGSIAILIFALNIIKNARPDQLLKMAGGLIGILAILWGFMKLSSKMSMEGAGLAQLIALAGSIAILMIAMVPLALLPLGRLAQAVGTVVIIMAALYGFMALTRSMTMSGTALAQFIALAGAIVILVIAMIPLALLPLGKLAQAVGAVVLILLSLAGFMILINKFDGGSLSGRGMIGFVAIAAAIVILVYALMPLAALNPQQLLHFIGGMLAIMLGISLIIKTIKEMDLKNAVGGLLVLLSLSVLILAFSAALHDLKDTNFAIILAFSAGLALMCVGFAKAVEILSKLDPLKALKGILLLSALLAALGLVFALIGPMIAGSIASSLNQLAGSLNFISEMLTKFSDAMASLDENAAGKGENFINRLKSLFDRIRGLSSYSGDVRYFSDNLFSLWAGLETFQEHSSQMTDPANDNGLKFIQALADQATNLKILSTADINKLISNISGLGGAMILYARGAKEVEDEVGGLKPDETPDVTAAVKLMQAISQSLVDEGGFVIPPNMPTSNEFGTFGAQLAALAGALIEFETAGQGLGAGYQNGKSALEYFKQLKKDLTDIKYEDIYDAIQVFGTEEGTKIAPDVLTDFGTRISELGKALNAFAAETTIKDDKTGEMKPVDYSTAISALESFKGLEQDLKRIGNGGYLVTLGGEIATLGSNLKDFAGKINGDENNPGIDLGTEAVENALTVVERMIGFMEDMNRKLPTIGGIVGTLRTLWRGKNMDLTELGGQIGKLSEGLGTMGTNLNTASWADNTGAKNAFETLDAVIELMVHIQNFYRQLEIAGYNGQSINPLAAFRSLSDFISYFVQLDGEGNIDKSSLRLIEQISEFMKVVDRELTQWANDNGDQLDKVIGRMEAFKLFMEGMSALGNSSLTVDWKGIGAKFTTDVATSITEGSTDVVNAVSKMMTDALTSGSEAVPILSWTSLGENIVDGIGNGIKNHQEEYFWVPIQEMMQEAYRLGKESIDSNSPSKLFMKLGSFIGEGTAIGIRKSTEEVGNTSAEMGEVALESARNIIEIIAQIMSEEGDLSPTISPVLDLTNIRDGASSIGGLFGTSSGLTLNGQHVTISTDSENEITMPKDYSDSFGQANEELANLRKDIQNLAEAMSNIKMVMNTGAVVGAIGPDIDRFLGERGFYASRTTI